MGSVTLATNLLAWENIDSRVATETRHELFIKSEKTIYWILV